MDTIRIPAAPATAWINPTHVESRPRPPSSTGALKKIGKASRNAVMQVPNSAYDAQE